jgi:hypothetical protein
MTWERFEDVAIEDKIAQLGEPAEEFALRGLGFLRSIVLASILTGAGLTLEVLLIGVLHVHQHELLLLGLALLLSGVMLLVRALRNRGLRVLVFPEGLVRVHRGEAQALCWEEIDQVLWQKSEGGHWRAWIGGVTLSLQAADGRRMKFDDSLPRLAQLAQIVRQRTLSFLWPKALMVYEAGHTLDFGKLRISQRGLSNGKETLPWSLVQKVKSNATELSIYKKGKRGHYFDFTLSDIPNFHVLQALLAQQVPVERMEKESEVVSDIRS